MRFILDVGSGASLPDIATARRVVDAIKAIDTHKHEVVLKAQLFTDIPPNTSLAHSVFGELYGYGKEAGYQVTASVFDKESLVYLLGFEVPFIKIACRPDLYWLVGEIPRKVPVYVSVQDWIVFWNAFSRSDGEEIGETQKIFNLACVPKYPASVEDYGNRGPDDGVSDHTIDWELFRKWNGEEMVMWEVHFALDDASGPDAGPFARRVAQLQEVLR